MWAKKWFSYYDKTVKAHFWLRIHSHLATFLFRILVSIDSIHEVCEGKKTEMFQHFSSSNFDANCCFSIYHGDHVESLDLVTTNGEEARTWISGLKYLLAGISDEDSLARRQRTRDQYPSFSDSSYTTSVWKCSLKQCYKRTTVVTTWELSVDSFFTWYVWVSITFLQLKEP